MVRQRARGCAAGLTLLALTLATTATAVADGHDVFGAIDDDFIQTSGLGAAALAQFAGQTPGSVGGASRPPWFNFASTSYCSRTPPDQVNNGQPSCTAEFAVCNVNNAGGAAAGPAVWVWRIEVDATGRPTPGSNWERINFTCLASLVPGADNVLTMQMILDEFHKTNFARPTAAVQPVGLKTLVNLPTYYELKWPSQGFQPGESDSTTLVGRRVDIEPVFVSATYIFGDGEAVGPIKSLGGPHPTGDVIHTYRRKMVAPVQVNATYSGRFRVDGGAWVTIPDTVTIQGTPSNLTVAEAKARLYTS